MKYLNRFQTYLDFMNFINSEDYEVAVPNVFYLADIDQILYSVENTPLYIEAIDNVFFNFSGGDLDYSIDLNVWESLIAGVDSPTFNSGTRVYVRASGLNINSSSGIGTFSMSGRCNVGGNLLSMYYGDQFKNYSSITSSYQFASLFKNSTICDASRLIFPDKSSSYSYLYMFDGCASLTHPPLLLPSNPGESTYAFMFRNCASLKSIPWMTRITNTTSHQNMFQGCTSLKKISINLKAYRNSCYQMFYGCTSLVSVDGIIDIADVECCKQMFQGCTSLINAPALPATILTKYCYNDMFNGCTSLVNAPALPATTLADYCYKGMFNGCTSLVNAPALPATTLVKSCYSTMFANCISLVNAPELPALTMISYCYELMFYGCTKLNYIKAMFLTTPSSSYNDRWVQNVAASGTFVKNSNATWDKTGSSGVPSGWTVVLEAPSI